MHFTIKRYIDGTPTEQTPNQLPPIKNPSVLKIIDHAVQRNNRIQSQTNSELSFQNKK